MSATTVEALTSPIAAAYQAANGSAYERACVALGIVPDQAWADLYRNVDVITHESRASEPPDLWTPGGHMPFQAEAEPEPGYVSPYGGFAVQQEAFLDQWAQTRSRPGPRNADADRVMHWPAAASELVLSERDGTGIVSDDDLLRLGNGLRDLGTEPAQPDEAELPTSGGLVAAVATAVTYRSAFALDRTDPLTGQQIPDGGEDTFIGGFPLDTEPYVPYITLVGARRAFAGFAAATMGAISSYIYISPDVMRLLNAGARLVGLGH